MTAHHLLISEVFGPTIQGEGPAVGQRATFVRTAGCNVGCSWCDTKYSWSPEHHGDRKPRLRTVVEVVDEVRSLASPGDIVVVTGGEPLTQQAGVLALSSALKGHGFRPHLETAGVHVPSTNLLSSFETVVVSPKLSHSGVKRGRAVRPTALSLFAEAPHVWFKFVVRRNDDLDEVAKLQSDFGFRRVMVMAEGVNQRESVELTRHLVDDVVSRGWSITPRLHVWLWGDVPGR